MLFSTAGQGPVFLWMAAAGLLIGALYSLTDALRCLLDAGFWLGLVIDLFFGLISGLILIAAMVFACYGRFRFYELLGAMAGFVLFRLGVDPPLRRAVPAVISKLRRILDRVSSYRLIKVIFK